MVIGPGEMMEILELIQHIISRSYYQEEKSLMDTISITFAEIAGAATQTTLNQ
ncbi:hypothetical protein [Cedecea davisae]|uniref:hypothetical protein n=1 Tax=Cedecea davisae TaxID=158484 RepID=UPI0024314CD7|nr:hypothetical protein [Cedecea davisae]